MRIHLQTKHLLWVLPFFALLLAGMGKGWAVNDPASGKQNVFFSQGQAIYNPQDRSRSQHEAVHDFLAQAVTQALGSFLSPSQMGTQLPALQEKILKQPERYVQTYQIFSEDPGSAGMYRVTGQVSIAMDVLRKDLARSGLDFPESSSAEPSETVPEPDRTSAVTPPAEKQEPREIRREGPPSRQGVFWVVAENWNQEWHLPGGKKDAQAIFAANVLQESRDFGWSLQLPQQGSLTVDENGNVALDRVLSEARALGVQDAIVGSIVLREDRDRGARVESTLRILNVSTGKSQGQIHKEYDLGESSAQEAAMELASTIVPQLDSLLREPAAKKTVPSAKSAAQLETVESTSKTPPQPDGEAPKSAQSLASLEGTGEWTLRIRSDRPYVDWAAMEKNLREQFKSMQVKSLELGPEEGVVRVDGVDGRYFTKLNGTRLRGGVQVQITDVSQETRTLSVSFTRADSPQPETRQ